MVRISTLTRELRKRAKYFGAPALHCGYHRDPRMSASYGTIEVVRGRLTEERAAQLVRFWTGNGVLDEAAARARLGDVVCVLLDPAGEIAGVNSVYAAPLDLVGGRQFWVYRNYLAAGAQAARQAMAHRAAIALNADFEPADEGPVGICFLIEDRADMERNPGADWLYPRSHYAGDLADGRQVRIRYFDGARIGPAREPIDFPLTLDHSYLTVPFRQQDAVDAEEVIDLWTREGAMPEDEARRRVDEVVAVSTRGGELVAVATAYLQQNEQLGMDMWHVREFVAEAHRASRLGWSLALVGRDYLQAQFVGAADTRASGIVYEVENEGLKQHMDYGYWPATDFLFIGENERGDHVRVHYFPGALVPGPPE
jgi:hypothetical protein